MIKNCHPGCKDHKDHYMLVEIWIGPLISNEKGPIQSIEDGHLSTFLDKIYHLNHNKPLNDKYNVGISTSIRSDVSLGLGPLDEALESD